ncbi:MAG: type II secretion system F family protein, partial [Campylobacterota bacterium]|nr:type II secretion system F family protein [Campylobacterota bacterium]
MKYYKITLSEKGKKREEGIYAKDKKDAQKKAKKIPKVVVIKVVESTPPIGEVLKNNILGLIQTVRQKKINPDSLIAAIRQLAVMTNAGISIHEALIEIA